ncbi:alpha/beta hydrolase [Methylopila musalis]|uniref:Alpha/beta hydrolase n=1 Tax=Methylopila musalis TaxID=1134781 RepID=A0ABW3Z7C2_9HYPH
MPYLDSIDDVRPPSLGQRVNRFLGAAPSDPLARADQDMAEVIEELRRLDPEPIEDLTPAEARRQPTLADALKARAAKLGVAPVAGGVAVHDVTYMAASGRRPARLYRPREAGGALPVTLYFHAGGFVLSDIDGCDAGARAMAARTGGMVVSVDYARAPERPFPAAHDDAVAAYRWLLDDADRIGGDPDRIVVMGEGAGANLALHACVAARDLGLPPPLRQALVTPLAGVDMEAASYVINAHARPLDRAMMGWLLDHALPDAASRSDPRIDLIGRADLAGLPPATIVTAEIDPLRSEGWALSETLRESGVAVNAVDVEGVTHGFFGLGEVVRAARLAQDEVARDLICAFAPDEHFARFGHAL